MEDRITFIKTNSIVDILDKMKEWGYVPIKEKPDMHQADKWWAGFGYEPTRTISFAYADNAEEAVRQAAIKAIAEV